MATTVITGVQYSGIWSLAGQANAKALTTWPVIGPALYAWGRNTNGELGLGTSGNYVSSPTQVGALKNWSTTGNVADNFSIAVKTDGTLWTWGYNPYGQLGLGNTTYYSSPKQVGSLTAWLTVAGGRYQGLAIKTDGTLWSWGFNNNGQLGLGNRTSYSSPKQIGALTNWSKISCGFYFPIAIKTDGTLWSWGDNTYGQLGSGTITNRSSPVQVGSLTNWLSVTCGMYHAVATKTDGTFWSWGYNFRGQLGLGNRTSYSSPKQVGSLTTWLKTGAANQSSYAIKTDGTLWSWGKNGAGCLGLGNTTYYSSPKQVGSLTTWLNVSAGYGDFAMANKTDGTLWAWGTNAQGVLGQGNTTDRSSPVQVGLLTTWTAFSCNKASALGILLTSQRLGIVLT